MRLTKYGPLLAAAAATVLAVPNAAAFEFHGYFRSGVGANTEGGDQVCFQTPGAPAKYRLGNECETYAELAFLQNLYQNEEDGSYFNVAALLAFVVEGEGDFEEDDPALREMFAEGGNLFGGFLEGASFWAGKRFYRRHDVHMNDFYFWDSSGTGGGVQDVNLGFGKLAYAYFRNVDDDFNESGGRIQVEDRAVSRHDLRIYDIKTNENGALTVGLDYRFSDESQDDFDGNDGFMATVMHFQGDLWGGFNKIALQYGQGSAASLANWSDDRWDNDAQRWRVVEQLVVQPSPNWSGQLHLTYEDSDNPFNEFFDRTWFSAGIRPIYHINDHLSIAFELGYDQIDPNGDGDTRRLTKFTIAPQLTPERGYWSRPAIRAFVTFADWNEAAQENGLAGGVDGVFGDDTDGITFGLQAEAWW